MTEWNQNSDNVRDVKGYEGLYKVNIYGDVYSIRSNREMTKLTDRYGYYVYNLRKDNQLKKVKAHKIVADAFLGERPLGTQVNHIDEDKKNNCVWNLEYVTPKENTNYGTRNIRAGRANRNNPAFSKPVKMFDINGTLLAEYPSRKEAARQTGLRSGDICNAVIHNWKIGGYVWKNADLI